MVGAQKTASICRRVLLILPRVIGGKLYSSMGWLDVDGLLDVHLHK